MIFATFLFFAGLISHNILNQQQKGKINWIEDIEEGMKTAIQSDKPLFIIFRCVP
jgi:hypothetical protein